MGAEKNIVAFELGSSAIRAVIGQKKPDGSLQLTGYAKEVAAESVRKGVVNNIDKTIAAIASIRKHIEQKHKVFVTRIYVGVTGQSLHTVGSSVSRQQEAKMPITEELRDSIIDENRTSVYPNAEVLDVIPQEYRLGTHLTTEPVGVMSDRIEGCFKNIIARRSLRENISQCVAGAKLEVADYFISPVLLADYLLSDNEKRSGCALVDFGAETTTVVVYEKNILRHLVVIPLGGATITNDIAQVLHIEHSEAEQLKLAHGDAAPLDAAAADDKEIAISNDRRVKASLLHDIVAARQQEILANVWQHLRDYADRLISGIIFTGGASAMKGLEKAFAGHHGFDKVKTRQLPTPQEFTSSIKGDIQQMNLATLVAMLLRGDQECTSEQPAEPDLFHESPDTAPVFTGQHSQTSNGVVREQPKPETPADKEEEPVEEKDAEEAVEQKEKRPGFFSRMGRMGRSLGDWANRLVDPD